MSENELEQEKIKPNKAGVLLVHGLTGTSVEMKPLEKYLKKLGFEVENVLLAGHGASNEDMLNSTWQAWITSAEDAFHALQARTNKVILCGLSMGGIICSLLAAKYNVSGLVMLSPTLYYDGSITYNNSIDSLYQSRFFCELTMTVCNAIPKLGRSFYWEETPPYGIRDERIQRQITRSIEVAKQGGGNEFGVFRTYYASFYQMWQLVKSAQEQFKKVTCPVLIMHSLEDTLVSLKNPCEPYLAIASKNKAAFFITGSDHVMTLDLQKRLVHKTVASFAFEYASVNLKSKSKPVYNVITDLLAQAHFAKGALNAILHPDINRLEKEDWQAVYPEKRYAGQHLQSVVKDVHSISFRDRDKLVAYLPLFISKSQDLLEANRDSAFLEKLVKSILQVSKTTILGLGNPNNEIPGLGLNQNISADVRSLTISYLTLILDSLVKTIPAGAVYNSSVLATSSCVNSSISAAPLYRINGGQEILLNQRILALIKGVEKFYHANAFINLSSKIVANVIPGQLNVDAAELDTSAIEDLAVGAS